MVIVRHETSPEIALQVIRTREFWAGPILGDSGMNVEIEDHPSGYHNGQAESKGAFLRFDWDGVVVPGKFLQKINELVMPADHLIDEMPHRGILPVGTGQGLTGSTAKLRLIGVEFAVNIDLSKMARERAEFEFRKLFCLKMWRKWFFGLVGIKFLGSGARNIQSEIDSIVKSKPQIMVVMPPYAPYRDCVCKVYPKIM